MYEHLDQLQLFGSLSLIAFFLKALKHQSFICGWSLTCGHSPAGGLHEWPLPARPNRTEPWTHRTDPRIGLARTSSRRLASTPLPEDTFARSQKLTG